MKRIGVLTGGGDAPGLNAVIRAVVKTATTVYGWEVIGIESGFEGLLGETHTRRLGVDDVRGLLPRGGTILGSVNRGHFATRLEDGNYVRDDPVYQEAMRNFERLGLEALIVLGGEGSQLITHQFSLMGLPVIGVPKTIDNDLVGTDLTFGFDTALDIATEAIDRLHTTAESHNRVILVEVMGRHVGWIALQSGVAGGADVILIPEIPFYIEKVAAKVQE
ncbi:MAG TPA: ATP-dependent 6-phosphofructokinase, partial [Blastocatellia bacterium]